ncbi:MAG: LPS export ABC transporter permease LptG [Pseudobdellovibrionaceae bacterium]
MLSLADRYIARLFLTYFAAGLVIFVTVFCAVDALGTIMSFEGAALSSVFRYYIYYAPQILYQMVPVACLLSTIFTLSTLVKTNEMVALFSVGMSLKRISTPILILVAIISCCSFWMADQVLPALARQKNYIYFVELKKKPEQFSTVKTGKIWYRSKNSIYNIKTLAADNNSAQGLTLYYFNDDWKLIQMITAAAVTLQGDVWELKNGSVTLFTDESSFPLTSEFQTKTITMGEDAGDLKSTGNTSDMLSFVELYQYIEKNREAGLNTLRYEVDFHAKFAFALSGLVMSLLGISFSISQARSGGTMKNIGICLALVFIYWIFYSSGLTMGRHGALPPVLAGWLPNLLIASGAWVRLSRMRK